MNDLVKKEETAVVSIGNKTALDVPKLLEMAVQNGAQVESLERLMDLQDRWEAKQAKKAFIEALANFQSQQGVIYKNKEGHNFSYAPLADIQIAIGGLLRKCGLAYRFEQTHEENLITVACIVTHVDGHSERTEMSAMPDDSGSKNVIQARGSTVSYLQRYTLIGALGILTADKDVDGRVDHSAGYINVDQANLLKDLLEESGTDKDKFLEFFKADSVEHIISSKYERAERLLRSKIA